MHRFFALLTMAMVPGYSAISANVKQTGTDRVGDPLPYGAIARFGSVRFQQGELLTDVRYGGDGKRIYSLGRKFLRCWDAETGKLIQAWPGSFVRFAAAGTLAVEQSDTSYCLRRVADGKVIAPFGPVEKKTAIGAYSTSPDNMDVTPDGKIAAVSNPQGQVELWILVANKVVRTLDWQAKLPPNTVPFGPQVAFSPNGEFLLTRFRGEPTVRIWHVATGKMQHVLADHQPQANAVAWSADSKRVATSDDTRVFVWDASTGKLLQSGPAAARGLAFSRNGKILATVTSAGFALRDADTLKQRSQIACPCDYYELDFSPDDTAVVSTARDRTVRIWDVASGKEKTTHAGHRGALKGLAFTPDGTKLVTQSSAQHHPGDDSIRVWDVATAKELHTITMVPGFDGLWVSADGKSIFANAQASDGRAVGQAWDLATGKPGKQLDDGLRFVAFASDGSFFLTTRSNSNVKRVTLRDGRTWKPLGKELEGFTHEDPIRFGADNKSLIICSGNSIMVQAIPNQKNLHSFNLGASFPRIYGMAPSPDGLHLALGFDQRVQLVTLSGKVLQSLPGYGPFALSKDGRSLCWSDGGGKIVIWETVTGAVRQEFAGHQGGDPIYAVAFSPHGRTLATGGGDGTALLWDLFHRPDPRDAPSLSLAWEALARNDARAAWQAIRQLVVDTDQAVPFLRQKLLPTKPQELNRLIDELYDDQETHQAKAAFELEALGEAAIPALKAALESRKTAAARQWIERVLDKHKRITPETLTPGRLRWLRVIEALEYMASADALDVIESLQKELPHAAAVAFHARESLKRLQKNQHN